MQSIYGEIWKPIEFDDTVDARSVYKISNFGRVTSYYTGEAVLMKATPVNGYPAVRFRKKGSGQTSRYIHKLVAEHFLEKKEGDQYVIHLNYNKLDNRSVNLKWATKREKELHQFSNPIYKYKKNTRNWSKLTENQVRVIKKMLLDPNRKTRMKVIAKMFGVSEMQLYRIKSGENWGDIKV